MAFRKMANGFITLVNTYLKLMSSQYGSRIRTPLSTHLRWFGAMRIDIGDSLQSESHCETKV